MALVQDAQHEGAGRAGKRPMQEVFDHAAERFFLGCHRAIDEGTAADFAGQKPLFGHGGQQTGRRGVMPASLLAEHFPDLAHATRSALPEQLEHFQFAAGGMFGFWSWHGSVLRRGCGRFVASPSFYGFYHRCQWVKP